MKGDHLYYQGAFGVQFLSHHGIDIGDGTVVQYGDGGAKAQHGEEKTCLDYSTEPGHAGGGTDEQSGTERHSPVKGLLVGFLGRIRNAEVQLGLGRIVALYRPASTSYQIR